MIMGKHVTARATEIENQIVGEFDFIDWKCAGFQINRVKLERLAINLKINPVVKLNNVQFERFMKSDKLILNFKPNNTKLVCKIKKEFFIIDTENKTYQKLYENLY